MQTLIFKLTKNKLTSLGVGYELAWWRRQIELWNDCFKIIFENYLHKKWNFKIYFEKYFMEESEMWALRKNNKYAGCCRIFRTSTHMRILLSAFVIYILFSPQCSMQFWHTTRVECFREYSEQKNTSFKAHLQWLKHMWIWIISSALEYLKVE